MLVPVLQTTVAKSGNNVVVSFPTTTGFNYQLLYTTNLTNPIWLPVGSALPGNNATQSASDAINLGPRFYRLQVQ
jgi:hypothetical protein